MPMATAPTKYIGPEVLVQLIIFVASAWLSCPLA